MHLASSSDERLYVCLQDFTENLGHHGIEQTLLDSCTSKIPTATFSVAYNVLLPSLLFLSMTADHRA